MIKANFNDFGMRVEGHAPREPGSPENPICAAVSALTQTARDAFKEVARMSLTNEKERSGLISFDWEELTPAGAIILETWKLGLINLAMSFPGTIDVTYGP